LEGSSASLLDDVVRQTYLSADTDLNIFEDQAAGGHVLNGILNPGESFTYTRSINSYGLDMNDYNYIIIIIDRDDVVSESNENNNLVIVPLSKI
jgi:hypothetical protein